MEWAEENGKFRLSAFRERLIAHLEANLLALSFSYTNVIDNYILMYEYGLGIHQPTQHALVHNTLLAVPT